MLLGRLRIRGKLALLVLIPLLATISLTIATAFELAGNASRAQHTANAVRVARLTGELIRELQMERLLAIGVLRHDVAHSQLTLQTATVLEKEARLRDLGEDLVPTLATSVGNLRTLKALREDVLAGTAGTTTVFNAYRTAIAGLIDGNRLMDAVDGDTTQGREVIALDATMRVNEGFASLLTAMAIASKPAELAQFASSAALILPSATRFNAYATPEQRALFSQTIAAVDARLGGNVIVAAVSNPNSLVNIKQLPPFSALYSLTGIGRFAETKIINDAITAADASADRESTKAVGFVAVSAGTILIVILLGVAIGRSVAGPLRRLTQSADRVARLAESELVRVADDDSPSTEPARLRPIDVAGRDELGDLARAFGRVQETAARLVERQVAGRRNVAQMFGHVGRRTQNLVGRQIALIDRLENEETEPSRLRDLYRLDHVSSRLRRSASSLVVLSGVSGADEHMAPIALGDVIRLALAEIEDYSRVDIETSTSVRVVPSLINDLALLLAELMENAATFSPPQTRVTVSAVTTGEGAHLTIVDHGLGMSAERLAEENARLTRRERLDLAPTEVLGLFVVGRLARRHGLRVVLRPTDGGGVSVLVEVPTYLLTSFGPLARTNPPSTASARQIWGPPAASPSAPEGPSPSPVAGGLVRRGSTTPAHAPSPVTASSSVATSGSVVASSPVVASSSITAGGSATAGSSVTAGSGAGASARGVARLTVANVAPELLDVPALTRASQSLDEVEPWDAFGAIGVGSTVPSTSSPVPGPSGLSALHRRVPGATLDAIGSTDAPLLAVPTQFSDALQARETLADFESGVARAMAEVAQDRYLLADDQAGHDETTRYLSEARHDGDDEEGSR